MLKGTSGRFEVDFRPLNAFPDKLQNSNLTLGLAMKLNGGRGYKKGFN